MNTIRLIVSILLVVVLYLLCVNSGWHLRQEYHPEPCRLRWLTIKFPWLGLKFFSQWWCHSSQLCCHSWILNFLVKPWDRFCCTQPWISNLEFLIWKIRWLVFFCFLYRPSFGIAPCVGMAGSGTWLLHLTQPCLLAIGQVLIWVGRRIVESDISPRWEEEVRCWWE